MPTKLVYLTAGAGGMYCGSCLHDNALAKAIIRQGWEVLLVPFYTPIRTDEDDISIDQVFFGGINVYLQQKIPLFRLLPKWLDSFLDNPKLIRRVTSRAIETNAAVLGSLALSMLQGAEGNQRKEVRRVVDWLVNTIKPDVVLVSNLLTAGFVPELKRRSKIPVIITLQGDDVFLNSLPERDRRLCLEQIQKNNAFVDGFIVHSAAFRDYMADYFRIAPERIEVTPLGIDTKDFINLTPKKKAVDSPTRTIGYLARLAPEKGLQHLIDAFVELQQDSEFSDVHLQVAGWLSPECQSFADAQWKKLEKAGLSTSYKYWGVVDRQQKLDFLQSTDVFCVPVEHVEPKGLFALEAIAASTPVILPKRGALDEIVTASGGGLLYDPAQPGQLVDQLKRLLRDPVQRSALGNAGREFVLKHRNELSMATETMRVVGKFLDSKES
jgi:glycosyltransferase involved in cell wall biosynthesis